MTEYTSPASPRAIPPVRVFNLSDYNPRPPSCTGTEGARASDGRHPLRPLQPRGGQRDEELDKCGKRSLVDTGGKRSHSEKGTYSPLKGPRKREAHAWKGMWWDIKERE